VSTIVGAKLLMQIIKFKRWCLGYEFWFRSGSCNIGVINMVNELWLTTRRSWSLSW